MIEDAPGSSDFHHSEPVTGGVAAPPRIRLTVEYDGAHFAGWQRQAVARTVQGELESAAAQLFQPATPLRIAAAGRTDAGVHAVGQVVSIAGVPARWTPAELARALNAVLPRDMRVRDAASAAPDFHARFSAVARGYIYRVATTPDAFSPFIRRWSWPLGVPLEIGALNEAAQPFAGTHEFRAFARSGQPARGYTCTIHRSQWRPWGTHGVAYSVIANRFLHHMVRYMVGTMVAAASGRRPLGDVAELLATGTIGQEAADGAARPRHGAARAGVQAPRRPLSTSPPAPPEGLFLARVYYPGDSLDEDLTDEILS